MGPCVVSHEKSGTILPNRKPPSVDCSGYKSMYAFVPVDRSSIAPPYNVVADDGRTVKVVGTWKADEDEVVKASDAKTRIEFLNNMVSVV